MRRGDEGSVLLLGLGFLGICLLALAVVTDTASLFLQRMALQARADAGALNGAQGIDLDAYYAQGATTATALIPSIAVARVVAVIQEADTHDPISGLAVEQIRVVDQVVRVELAAPGRLTFFTMLEAPTIRVRSDARLDHRPGA
jgi:uncharacterized membrane protein